MKVAAIDLGSNTFLCLIAEVENSRIQKVYSDTTDTVRLGQGLNQTKKFHPEALQRAEASLARMQKEIEAHRPEHILAMATSAARDAENQQELFNLGKKYGIPIEIIPGDREAHITYQGAVSGLSGDLENRLIIDIGGGSTEYIFGTGPKLLSGQSFDIGVVRLTEKFMITQPTTSEQLTNARLHLEKFVQRAMDLQPQGFTLEQIVAVAGTPTALVAAEIGGYDAAAIEAYRLSVVQLESWLERLKNSTVAQIINMGIPAGRADVILMGVLILLETLKKFNLPELRVSTRGVRFGVALEMGRRFSAAAPRPV